MIITRWRSGKSDGTGIVIWRAAVPSLLFLAIFFAVWSSISTSIICISEKSLLDIGRGWINFEYEVLQASIHTRPKMRSASSSTGSPASRRTRSSTSSSTGSPASRRTSSGMLGSEKNRHFKRFQVRGRPRSS